MSVLECDPCSFSFDDGKCRLTEAELLFELPRMVDGQRHFMQRYVKGFEDGDLDILAEATLHLSLACFREWQNRQRESWWTKFKRRILQ